VLNDRLAHGLALLGIAESLIVGALGETNGTSGDRRAGAIKGAHGNLEALANVTEAVLIGDHNVIEPATRGINDNDRGGNGERRRPYVMPRVSEVRWPMLISLRPTWTPGQSICKSANQQTQPEIKCNINERWL